MAGGARFNWIRVVVAVILAELLPLLLLVAIVSVYSLIRQKESLSPEEFAPLAGNWVGPIGGFLATLLFAWWAARRALEQRFMHGTAVGVGTAVLDLGLGILLGGGGAIHRYCSSRTAAGSITGVLNTFFLAKRASTKRGGVGRTLFFVREISAEESA